MRKLIFVLVGVILAVLAINANLILNDTFKKQELQAEISTLRPWWVAEGVSAWKALPTMDEKLRQALVLAVDIPESYWGKTRCYYNYFDLNDDGAREVLAVLIGPYTSGSGGNMAVLLTEKGGAWHLQQLMTLIHTPVLVSKEKTNGYCDLYVIRAGGGTEVEPVRLSYTREEGYTKVSNAPAVALPQKLEGTLLMANDLAKDLINGEWVSLEKK